jgi:hypothetical protein
MELWLAYLPAHIVIAGVLGHWILLPLVKQSGTLTLRLRFDPIDFVALLVLLLTVLSLAANLYPDDDFWSSLYFVPLVCVSLGCVLTMWCGSVSVVTKAQITSPVRRLIVVLLIIPGTLVVITAAPVVVGLAAGFVTLEILKQFGIPPAVPMPSLSDNGLSLLAVAVAAAVLHGLSAWTAALPQGLVEQDGGGDGEVEAIDAAQEGQSDRLNVLGPP